MNVSLSAPLTAPFCRLLTLGLLMILPTVGPQPARAELDGRVGHTALPTVGRNTGITQLELMPYVMIEDQAILFGDIRGFLSNEGRFGGNLGAGVRYLEPNELFVLGLNGYFDADQTTGEWYQQLGFGLEAQTRFGGVYSNFYFPVGDENQTLRSSRSNARFQGNQILFDNLQIEGEALSGLDIMFSLLLPGEFAREHNMEVSAGWYQFQGNHVAEINGFRVQVDGEIVPNLNAQAAVTNDDYFGPNVAVGLFWRFGNTDLGNNTLDRQMRRFVNRNSNVVVSEWESSGSNLAMINPLTGLPYEVQHVSSLAIAGTGTAENPFATLAAAQGAGGDIIFVHGGSSLNESIVLNDGQMLLGGGTEHLIADQTFGDLLLPADATPGGIPTLLNSAVNAVTLGDNSRIAGFDITNPNGVGIQAVGVDNFLISDIRITNPNGHGIFIDNATNGILENIDITGGASDGIRILNSDGVIQLENIGIDGAAGAGIHISGGEGSLDFLGLLDLQNIQGNSLFISDLTTSTTVDDQGTTDTSDDVTTTNEGTVNIEDLQIAAADGGAGIVIQNVDGQILIDQADVTTTNATGVELRSADRVFIGGGSLNSTGGPAVDVENSQIDFRLESLFADGGTNGIRMIDTNGQLVVFGNGNNNSGGLIENTTIAILQQNSGMIGLQQLNFDQNGMVADVDDSTRLEITGADITNTQTQIINAVNLQTLSLTQSVLDNNANIPDTAILFAVDTPGSHTLQFNGNLVRNGPRRILHATTLPGGETASLNSQFLANDIQLDIVNGVATQLDWTGAVQSDNRNNLIVGNNDNQIAFNYLLGDSNENSQFNFQQNGVRLNGTNSTGFLVNALAPMVAQLNENLVQFNGINGVGMRLSSSKTSTYNLNLNTINDFAGGATGILFPTVFDNSSILFSGNLIDLTTSNAFVDRGLIISNVGGTDTPTVSLSSFFDNVISGATTIFSIPTGSGTGQLQINGQTIR